MFFLGTLITGTNQIITIPKNIIRYFSFWGIPNKYILILLRMEKMYKKPTNNRNINPIVIVKL